MAADELSLGEALGSWPRLNDVLDTLGETVTIRDLQGRLVFANRAAVQSMGIPAEDLTGRPSEDIMSEYIVQDEEGRPLTIDDVPSMRVIHGEDAAPVLMRVVHRHTGRLAWQQLKAAPLRDERGELIGALTIIEDLTAVKEAELRMGMLAESGRILASSLDYQETVGNIAHLAVPVLADWCAVDFIDANLQRERVVVAHQDPAKLELAARARKFEPDQLEPGDALVRVLTTGRSMLYPRLTPEMIEGGARSEEHLELLRELAIVSVLLVPMVVPARTIGVMTLVTAESRRQLGQDDVELAEQLGRRAAVAVENARLHTTLTTVAETLQRSLLPDAPPNIPGWDIATLYRAGETDQRVDVGGDFYDLFPTPDGYFVIIGDVTGKGVEAATLTSLLRHGARFTGRSNPRPSAVLAELDAALRERPDQSLCTALCACIRGREVVLASAGHPPALCLHPDGSASEVPEAGPLLGAFEDSRWPEQKVRIAAGDLLLLYTDGVTETPGDGERFGSERLEAVLHDAAGCSAAEVVSRLDEALVSFRGDTQLGDDIAVLALRAEAPDAP